MKQVLWSGCTYRADIGVDQFSKDGSPDPFGQARALLTEAIDCINSRDLLAPGFLSSFRTSRDCTEHYPCFKDVLDDILHLILNANLDEASDLSEMVFLSARALRQARSLAWKHGVVEGAPRLAEFMAQACTESASTCQKVRFQPDVIRGLYVLLELYVQEVNLLFFMESFFQLCRQNYGGGLRLLSDLEQTSPAFSTEMRFQYLADMLVFAPLKQDLLFEFFQNLVKGLIGVPFSAKLAIDRPGTTLCESMLIGLLGQSGKCDDLSDRSQAILLAGLDGAL